MWEAGERGAGGGHVTRALHVGFRLLKLVFSFCFGQRAGGRNHSGKALQERLGSELSEGWRRARLLEKGDCL